MNEKYKLNQYDIGIIMNALIDMRNMIKEEKRDASPIEDVMLKILNISEKKKITCKIVNER